MLTTLQKQILRIVQSIPNGRVVSYGQVATALGMPRAARLIGQAMSKMEDVKGFPWWRVVNNKGVITIRGNAFATKTVQKQLLEAEGVQINDDFSLNINLYRHLIN